MHHIEQGTSVPIAGVAPPAEDIADRPVAVVLVNWNNWRDTVECLASLLTLRHRSYHIYLVDNDSRDESVEHLSRWLLDPTSDSAWRKLPGVVRITDKADRSSYTCRIVDRPRGVLEAPPSSCRVTIIRSGGNLGYAGGCNVGITAAGLESFDYFWFVNTDTVMRPDALNALLRRASDFPRAGIVGSTLLFYDRPTTVQAMCGARWSAPGVGTTHIGHGYDVADIPADASNIERQLAYVFGASMLVSSEFIRRIGPMQEDYFLYFEEFDWAVRGRGAFSLGYAPDSHLFHKSGASSSKVMPAFTSHYYYRNRLRFARRFFPERVAATMYTLGLDMLRHLARGRWTTVRIIASVLREALWGTALTNPTASAPPVDSAGRGSNLGT